MTIRAPRPRPTKEEIEKMTPAALPPPPPPTNCCDCSVLLWCRRKTCTGKVI